MSETIVSKGMLIELYPDKKSIQAKIDKAFEDYPDLREDINEAEEWYRECDCSVGYSDSFFIRNDKLYKIECKKHFYEEEADYRKIKKISPTSYFFDIKFYNGGTSLSEQLDEGLEDLENHKFEDYEPIQYITLTENLRNSDGSFRRLTIKRDSIIWMRNTEDGTNIGLGSGTTGLFATTVKETPIEIFHLLDATDKGYTS